MSLTDSSSLAPNYLTLTPEQVMQELNPATRTEYRSVCIHHLIEEQVLKTPALAAVEFQGEVLSYQELNKRANQLAHYLQKLGVGPDQLVGLCMLRSVEMLVSILAILKAGGAYVPLDFAYPQERLSYMLADSNAQVVLTTNASLAVSPQINEITANVQTVRLDDAWPLICQESDANPLSDVQPHHLAYCIYTSGSTGKPKGVAMEHQALANLMAWHADTWLSEVGTRILLFSPISFDVSFHEIAAGWCTGGTLLQIDEDTRRNPLALLEFILEHKVEKIYLPFVALQQLALAAEKQSATLPLREIIVGGEPLQITPEIGRFLTKTGCALQNQYGSTECLVITAYTLPPDPAKWPVQVPVGVPTYNSRVYILDEQLQPVPMGAIGEIYADSDCLARGYYNHPELTNKSFIPNPFKPDFCGRLYKLGDLGRYLPDGNIECLGRVDHQVKIRGFRVELGEIEAVLAKHAFVDECAVMPFEDKGGNKRLVGYVVPSSGQKDDQLGMALRLYLEQELPDYMVPAAILVLDKMPLTPSGKINRRELSQPASYQRALSTQLVMPESEIEQRLAHIWQELLQVNTVGIKDNFFDLGGTSLLLVQAHNKVTDAFNIELPAVTLLQYPTIEKLAGYIYQLKETSGNKQAKTLRANPAKHLADKGHQAIAVIGLACRFPGAENADLFWQNLANGVESITFFSDEELDFKDPSLLKHPNYVNAGAVLSDIDKFDAAFFGYSPKEAEVMDPQQRIFLECAWSALEDAGINPDNYAGSIGVYGGSSMSTYLINNVVPNFGYSSRNPFLSHRLFKTVSDLRLEQGNGGDHLTMRVSYKLNLKGPSVNVQTTCSTSLVAVHVAAQGLLNGECDVALAGGVSVFTPHKLGYLHQEGMILSPDGHCRAFDAQAQGTIFGNGVGVVILKRLDEALAAGDNIVAVIKGSAINNDGASKVGYTAPSVEGQAAVIIAAQEIAEVEPETITYVEAHGTGTVLGDPIEIAGLTQAFERQGQDYKPQYCAIGSVKTNIGHLDEAAGIAGFIKAVLALKHQQIPPSLHFNQPNPHIDFKHGPFYVNTELTAWQTNGNPRRAGVSSFGIGGTNCHIVLEEAPEVTPALSVSEREGHVLILSGKTEKARRELAQQYVDYLASHPDTAVADMCFTANTGRQHFKHRFAVVAESNAQLHENLAAFVRTNGNGAQYWAGEIQPSPPSIAFLFTGQGSQYVQMGWKLYNTQPLFRDILNQCDEILLSELEQPLLSVLFPEQMPTDQSSLAIHQTAYTQPALFALEYALAQLWKSWGIQPDVVMGHSVGEYVAACIAGVFSLEDGLKLIAARGRLMQSLPEDGAMVSLQATEAQVTEWLKPYVKDVSIAAINGSQSIVISGHKQSINELCSHLEGQGVKAKPLTVSHAFHSPLMDPILSDFRSIAQQITYTEPQIKLISNVTGALAQVGEVTNAEYWVRHVRQAVRFADGMAVLEKQAVNVLVEIGPKPVLLGMGQQCLPDYQGLWLPSLRPNREWPELLASLAKLALAGVAIDWTGFDKPYARRRLSLPTYPFQRERYWLDIVQEKSITIPLVNATSSQASHPLIGQQLPLAGASEIRFHNQISMHHPSWLKEYVVFDQMIMPGTGYVEMALAAGAVMTKSAHLWLEDVAFLKVMSIPEHGQTKTIQTVLKPLEQKNGTESGYTFQIFSLEESNESGPAPQSWTLHASGKVFAAKALSEMPVIDLHAMQRQCTQPMDIEELYQKSRQQNINFGPSYQCMTQLWRTEIDAQAETKAIALDEVKLPDTLRSESSIYQLHPVMLDIALLALETIYPNQAQQNNYIPVGVDRLRVFGRYSDAVWCSAHLRNISGDHQQNLSADFYLFRPDGQLFAVVEGFKLRHVKRQALLSSPAKLNDWLYEVKWQTLLPETSLEAAEVTSSGSRHWLILADKTVASQLATKLSAQGEQCILVSAGSHYEQIAPQQFIVNPANPEDFHQLLAVVPQLYGIVHCWSLDASETDVQAASLLGCGSALHLIQAVVEAYVMSEPPRLWLTTRGAQAVNEHAVQQVTQASLWGLGKVIALEHPALHTTQIDLDGHATSHDAQNLFSEISACLSNCATKASSVMESQIAFRDQRRYVARLSHYANNKASIQKDFLVSAEGSYLITGGLGGLGLLTARFLVEHGARHLVLVGRSEPTPNAKQQLSELAELGAKVVIAKADISDYQQVADILVNIERSTAPLRGIIHAAGVLDDGILQRLNWQRFSRVLNPKVQGAWNLHLLTKEYALDFFVLFSSSTSLLGTAGQANHAAANAFLDSLASYRQGLGMSGLSLSINWGAWSDVGVTARLNLNETLLKQGEGSISPTEGLQILNGLLMGSSTQVGVLPIDWKRFLRRHSAIPPFFASIYKSIPDQEGTNLAAVTGERWLASLKSLPYAEALEVLLEKLVQEVSIILGVAPSEIAFEQGFYEMGIDSLGTIEMRNRLQTLLDKRLSATVLFDYPSIMSLGRYLATEVLQLTPSKPVSNQPVLVEKPVLTESLLDDLSEDELEQLLLEEMKSL